MDKSTFKQPERAFDDLALLTGHTMDMPFVVITLHGNEVPFVKSCVGFDTHQVSDVQTFADDQEEITIVEDARKDKRFKRLTCVSKAPHFVFYAGVALKSAYGEQLGTLAVLDRAPRQLTSKQIESLRLLARQVIQLLEIKKSQNPPSQNSIPQPDAEQLKHIVEPTRVGTWEWNVQTGELRINDRREPSEIPCVGLDITDQITTESALSESHERYKKVTEATNDAIWDFDVVKNVIFLGKGFETLFGYNTQIASPSFEFFLSKIHPEDRHRVVYKIDAFMEDDSASNWHEEYRFLKADGTFSYVIDRAVIIRNQQGEVTRVVGAMTDISYRKDNERKLQNLNEKLEKHALDLERSNAELEQFAYIASHDLQEPLRMVTSFLNQLERKYKDQLDDKAQQYIYFAVDGARRMRQNILDLLEFSRVGQIGRKANDLRSQ